MFAANQTVAAQSLASQLAQQTSGGQPGLTQIITNAQGQILAIGAPQVSNVRKIIQFQVKVVKVQCVRFLIQ